MLMIYTRRDEKFRRSQQLSISYDKDNSGQMFEYNVYFCFLKRNRRLITHKHSKILKRCRVSVNDKHTNNPVIKFLPYPCKVCGRNLITGLTSAASPRVGTSSTCKVGQKLGVSLPPSVDMLPFGVTIPATVPQRWKIPEGLMNYPVHYYC